MKKIITAAAIALGLTLAGGAPAFASTAPEEVASSPADTSTSSTSTTSTPSADESSTTSSSTTSPGESSDPAPAPPTEPTIGPATRTDRWFLPTTTCTLRTECVAPWPQPAFDATNPEHVGWCQIDIYRADAPDFGLTLEKGEDYGWHIEGGMGTAYFFEPCGIPPVPLTPVTPILPTVEVRECYTGDEVPTVLLLGTPGISYTIENIDTPYGDKRVRATLQPGNVFATTEGWTLEADGTLTTVIDLGDRNECVTESPVVPPTVQPPGVEVPVVTPATVGPPTPAPLVVIRTVTPSASVTTEPLLADTGIGDAAWGLVPLGAGAILGGAVLLFGRRFSTQ